MTMYQKGPLLASGKTKGIFQALDEAGQAIPGLVWVENKNDITAFDDPGFTKWFASKGTSATTTTCRVFEILRQAGIQVAYVSQVSPTAFVAHDCRMIPLEVVGRRYSVGGYDKRHPELNRVSPLPPHRLSKLVVEMFLKTTKGGLKLSDGTVLVEGLNPLTGEEDPLIRNPYVGEWHLYHSKRPEWDATASLGRMVEREQVFRSCGVDCEIETTLAEINKLIRQVFLVLEGAWNGFGYRLIDLKIELGMDKDGFLRVADVIDNDSWRLRNPQWVEVSKQAFRDKLPLDVVEGYYKLVAELTGQFRMPKQALVLWRGSDKDPSILSEKERQRLRLIGIETPTIELSAHKATMKALQRLSELRAEYPAGGVIVTAVGRSNGLGPVLAAHTTWPVITVPVLLDAFPEDVWSSVRMPSRVPLLTAWPDHNAVDAALNVLAQSNPAVYMQQQIALEELDG